MKIKVSEKNRERLLELQKKSNSDSTDDVIGWLLDFWFSWSEREKDPPLDKFGFEA